MKILQENAKQLVLESKIVFGLFGSSNYNFDKDDRKLKITGKGFLGSKPQEYPLAELTSAVLQEQAATRSERSDPSKRTYRIELVRSDGSRLPLTAVYSSGKASKMRLVEKIDQFLRS
ncbi:MAG: hypothetical protein M3Y69_02650 [Verrucomicrobiota bacterium]|nr:hypothetical protein [Verrucomicrobiota bacterium]